MHKSKDRVALITGGSSGIGFEMARQMSKQGSRVIICGRSSGKLHDSKSKCPDLFTIQCDISLEDGRKILIETIKRDYPDLNMLVNNAGIVYRYSLTNTGNLSDRITNEWKTNYFAPVLLAQDLLGFMIKNRGTIVNVCSALSYVPLSIEPNYCATKAALMSMTQSMRLQYGKGGVKVVGIYYPEVDTPFQEGHTTSKAITAQAAASKALKGLNKGQDEINIGLAKFMYILNHLMPKKAAKMLNLLASDKIERIENEL